MLKEAGVTPPVSVDFMVPKGAETEAVAQVIQSMAAEAGFDMKIRVIEFATSFKQAEAGEFQALLCSPGADGLIRTAIPTSSMKTRRAAE